ncbi:hypothetical protein [Winogradskyella sp. A3E31]|uniref:hypothetical protein n=1 Tax=Winogradskyella sp. A3E31 TaxID=3349637 RepID=UPI00398A9C72
MDYLKKSTCILVISLLCSTAVFSQWTQQKGKGYYKLSAWYLETDQHYTDTGEIDPNVTRGNFNLNFYGDYGLTDAWDIITYIPFFARTYQNDVISGTTGEVIEEGEAVNSIGDIDIGIEYSIFNTDNISVSGTLIFGLPTGESDGGSDGSYQTGDGEFNQFLKLGAGIPFNLSSIPFYSKAYLGYNNRTEDFSDELRTGFEIGANLFNNNVWLIGRSDIVKSLKNGNKNAQNSQGNIFANNVEYISLGGELNYYFTKSFGASFAFTGAVSGRIIAANPTITAGVFLDVK